MSDHSKYQGMAALTICESLLLALNDRKILPEADILGILSDAATSHENGVGNEADIADHQGAAAVIRKIISGGNSVRRR